MDYVKLNGGGSLEADRNTLFELLLKKTRKLGRALSFEEARGDPELPNPNEYAQYFRSFSDAAAEAFRRIEFEKEYPDGLLSDKSDEPQVGAYSSAAAQRNGFEKVSRRRPVAMFSEEPRLRRGVKKMSSSEQKSEVEKMEEKKRERKVWTEESVIEAVKRFYDEQGRLPTAPDFRGECDYLPAEMTIRKHLGKKTEWLAAISHDEMDTMLRALSEAGLDDELDDPFEASGGATTESSSQPESESPAGEITRAKVARRANETIHQLLTEDFEIKEAEIKIHLEVVGLDKPVDILLEF